MEYYGIPEVFALAGDRALLRWPQRELSLAGKVNGFAENPQRFLPRVDAPMNFGFDEIEIKLRACAGSPEPLRAP